MNSLKVHIPINPNLYLKDPTSSELGRSIITQSIELLSKIGFEAFTFKKLGNQIHCPESSIYRYFENKHALLIYLTSWYWAWTEYRLAFATANIQSPKERLEKSIDILTHVVKEDEPISDTNEVLLGKIIFSESSKSYHVKTVEAEDKKGCFDAYKSVVKRVSAIILEITPYFPYAHMLVSTLIEGAHTQIYFAEHLPSLTDDPHNQNAIPKFYSEMVFNFLKGALND